LVVRALRADEMGVDIGLLGVLAECLRAEKVNEKFGPGVHVPTPYRE
jgi:hypothetical protein